MKEELLTPKDLKSNVPKWVVALCATLMFLSVFINSIGLNLMQINGALTEHIIKWINKDDNVQTELEAKVEELEKQINQLKKDSHKPTK